MLAQLGHAAGWVASAPSSVSLAHVPCGVVRGADGRKLSSRDGATSGAAASASTGATLAGLLDEGRVAASRTLRQLRGSSSDGSDTAEVEAAAETIGCGAARYYELSHQVGAMGAGVSQCAS